MAVNCLTLIRKVGKVELMSTFTTAACESWNVSHKYTCYNAGDVKQPYPWSRPSVRIIGAIKRQFLRREFCNRHLESCNRLLGHGRKHTLAIFPTMATITRCDLSPRFFCIDATLLCKFESGKI